MKGKQQTLEVTPAIVQWRDNTPFSSEFDDYYFSSEDGMSETDYVFLQKNQLSQRWSTAEDSPGSVFTIAETGFGTGLNFLCAWQLWDQQQFTHKQLHFISVDKYPLHQKDLAKAFRHWPELAQYKSELLKNYPPLVPGFHTLLLAGGNVRLTLIFDDAATAFQQVEGCVNGSIDCWFLDGFTPNRNPDMWSSSLFKQIARLSHPKTTFATFTTASAVRKGLTSVGFDVQKCPGLGLKREICFGSLTKTVAQPLALKHNDKPWFFPNSSYSIPGTATVIGAGLAGASIASNLAKRGWKVTVIEKHESVAQEGSGNPTGITFTKLSQFNNPQNRFYQLAYLYTTPLLYQLLSASQYVQGEAWNLNGVVRLGYNEKERDAQLALVASGRWPEEIATPLSPQETSDLIGFPCNTPSLLLKQGGWLRPRDAVHEWLNHPNIQLLCGQEVKTITPQPLAPKTQQRLQQKAVAPWVIQLTPTKLSANNTQARTIHGDIVILANSFGAKEIEQTQHLPLRSVRGQVTFAPSTSASKALKHALNYEGYTAPARDGDHCVGATFHPKAKHTTCEQEDHSINLNNLNTALPSFADAINAEKLQSSSTLHGRVGFRCQTPDYLPMLGPAPSLADFIIDYAPLRKGMLKDPMPVGKYHQGLYVSLAHGSRGITSAPYCAEILANIIMGDIRATDKAVIEALHPARFLIRDIKRRKL